MGRIVWRNGDSAMNTMNSPYQFHTLPGTGYVRESHLDDNLPTLLVRDKARRAPFAENESSSRVMAADESATELAKRRVAEAREAVERQKRLVERRRELGSDTRLDEVLLQLFRRSLTTCEDSLAAMTADSNVSDHKANPAAAPRG